MSRSSTCSLRRLRLCWHGSSGSSRWALATCVPGVATAASGLKDAESILPYLVSDLVQKKDARFSSICSLKTKDSRHSKNNFSCNFKILTTLDLKETDQTTLLLYLKLETYFSYILQILNSLKLPLQRTTYSFFAPKKANAVHLACKNGQLEVRFGLRPASDHGVSCAPPSSAGSLRQSAAWRL